MAHSLQNLRNYFSQALQGLGKAHKLESEPLVSRALDLGRTRLLFVEGDIRNSKVYLQRIEVVALNPDVELKQALKTLFEECHCGKKNIFMSLQSPQSVTRFLRFPKMTEKELRGVLQFEIEQYVPYELKNLYLDAAILQETISSEQGDLTEVFVAVAKKDYLDSLLQQFREVGVEIEHVGVDMLACMKCLEFFYPSECAGHVGVLDIGVQMTTLGIVRSGKPRFIRDLSFGSADIFKKIKTRMDLSDADVQAFIEGKTNVTVEQSQVFGESIENLVNDVKVSFDYYRDQSEDGSAPDKLFVCGIGSKQPFILESLQKAIDLPVQYLDLSSQIEIGPDVNIKVLESVRHDLSVAIGLLLRAHD